MRGADVRTDETRGPLHRVQMPLSMEKGGRPLHRVLGSSAPPPVNSALGRAFGTSRRRSGAAAEEMPAWTDASLDDGGVVRGRQRRRPFARQTGRGALGAESAQFSSLCELSVEPFRSIDVSIVERRLPSVRFFPCLGVWVDREVTNTTPPDDSSLSPFIGYADDGRSFAGTTTPHLMLARSCIHPARHQNPQYPQHGRAVSMLEC